jgi:hypothetical protein
MGVLLTLAGREGQWAMIFLVQEASESRLLGQRPLSCKTLLIPATGSLPHMIINVSFVRRKIGVQTVYWLQVGSIGPFHLCEGVTCGTPCGTGNT